MILIVIEKCTRGRGWWGRASIVGGGPCAAVSIKDPAGVSRQEAEDQKPPLEGLASVSRIAPASPGKGQEPGRVLAKGQCEAVYVQ